MLCYGDALEAATVDGTNEERKYVQHDASFNVTAVTSASGTVDERYVYDPYGKPTILTGAWGSRSGSSYDWKYMFQGLRYDGTTGLSDMRMRVYAPALGRALQADPAGYLDGTNRYQALRSSPANYVDPSGLAAGSGGGIWGGGGPGDDNAHPFGPPPLEWNPQRDGNGEGAVETWPAYPNPDGTWGGNGTTTTLPETRNPDGTPSGGDGVITLFGLGKYNLPFDDYVREWETRYDELRSEGYTPEEASKQATAELGPAKENIPPTPTPTPPAIRPLTPQEEAKVLQNLDKARPALTPGEYWQIRGNIAIGNVVVRHKTDGGDPYGQVKDGVIIIRDDIITDYFYGISTLVHELVHLNSDPIDNWWDNIVEATEGLFGGMSPERQREVDVQAKLPK